MNPNRRIEGKQNLRMKNINKVKRNYNLILNSVSHWLERRQYCLSLVGSGLNNYFPFCKKQNSLFMNLPKSECWVYLIFLLIIPRHQQVRFRANYTESQRRIVNSSHCCVKTCYLYNYKTKDGNKMKRNVKYTRVG